MSELAAIPIIKACFELANQRASNVRATLSQENHSQRQMSEQQPFLRKMPFFFFLELAFAAHPHICQSQVKKTIPSPLPLPPPLSPFFFRPSPSGYAAAGNAQPPFSWSASERQPLFLYFYLYDPFSSLLLQFLSFMYGRVVAL